ISVIGNGAERRIHVWIKILAAWIGIGARDEPIHDVHSDRIKAGNWDLVARKEIGVVGSHRGINAATFLQDTRNQWVADSTSKRCCREISVPLRRGWNGHRV